MSGLNARLIQKDALADIPSTSAGSAIIDLNGASKFSVQAIYDVQAPAAKTFDDGKQAVLVNQSVTYLANERGIAGNNITITLVGSTDPDIVFGIDVAGTDIVVTLATSGLGVVTTTATDLVTALNLDAGVSALISASGIGAVPLTDLLETPLATGSDSEVDVGNSSLLIPAHGLPLGFKIRLTTTGTLPAPFLTATDYFVIPLGDDAISLAASLAEALAGISIEIEDRGSNGGVGTLTGVALAGASVKFQSSNDQVNWVDIQAATSITVDGSIILAQSNVAYRYLKVVKALTSGIVDLQAIVLVIGPAT